MTEQERRVLAAQLWATRASVDAALVALGEQFADDDTPEGCTHPADQREDTTTMGGPVEWRCRACGFHSITDTTTEG